MLLTETIKNCTSAIKKRRVTIESKQHAETYAKALAQLAQATASIKETIDCATAMKDCNVVSTVPPDSKEWDLPYKFPAYCSTKCDRHGYHPSYLG